MTTGDGKLLTALSATPAMVCIAPEVTTRERSAGEVAAREMIRACPKSSFAPSARKALRAKKRPNVRLPMQSGPGGFVRRLLNDRLEVERTGIVAGHSGRAGQVQPEIQLVGAGTKV